MISRRSPACVSRCSKRLANAKRCVVSSANSSGSCLLGAGRLWQKQSTPGRAARNTQEGMGGHNRTGVVGSILEIHGNSMTVKTMSGQSITVTLGENTEYVKDRQPAKLSDFKPSDMVMVRGENAGANNWKAEVIATRTGGTQE